MFVDRRQARRTCAAWGLATTGWLALVVPAAAQQVPAAELTPAERAQRDADKVFKWILIHADKPRKPNPARDEKREEKRDEKPLAASRAKPAPRAAEAPPPAASAAVLAGVDEPAAPPVATPAPAAVIETAVAAVGVVETRAAVPSATPAPTPSVIAAEAVDEVLTPLFRAEPQFPANMLRTLRKGAVQLRFTVLPDGSVADAVVVSTTNARLNPSALAAIAQWRFVPLRRPQAGLVALGFDLD